MCNTRIRLFIVIAIKLASALSQTGTTVKPTQRKTFTCSTDICNVNGQAQFCSERESKCRNCLDIIDSCFEAELPSNCTSTCIEYHIQKARKNDRETTCQVFNALQNGRHNSSLTQLHVPGDVIEITCDPGYHLIGSKTLKCKEYGQWSHEFPKCKDIECPELPKMKNGYWSSVSNTGTGRFYVFHILQAKCNDGYTLQGLGKWECLENGSWYNPDGLYMPFCSEEEGINTWMILAFISTALNVVSFIYFLLSRIRRRRRLKILKKENYKTIKNKKDRENDEETALTTSEVNPSNIEDTPRLPRDISLHDEKLQRQSQSESKRPRDSTPNISSQSPVFDASPTERSECPVSSNKPNAERKVSRNKQSQKSEIDPSQAAEHSEGQKSPGNAGLSLHFNFTANNSADNSNNYTVFSNGVHSTNTEKHETPQTTQKESNDLENIEEEKSPIEESGTFQPSQPQPGDTEVKVAFSSKSFVTEPSESFDRRSNEQQQVDCDGLINGLAVQQSPYNEKDTARKLAMPNGLLNTDDISPCV